MRLTAKITGVQQIRAVISTGGKIQAVKTVIPADTEQTVAPDSGYDGLAKVVVQKIPSDYGKILYNGGYIRVI